MIWLKSCPKCGGALHDNSDIFGRYFACIQCGYYLTDAEEIAVLGYGFERIGLDHILAYVHPDNSRSIRIIKQLEGNGVGWSSYITQKWIRNMATLDVRPELAAGQDPFQRIMGTVEKLSPSEELVVIAPFEPVPLYSVMAVMGFGHTIEMLSDGGYKITFRISGAMEQEQPPVPRALGRNSRLLEQNRPTLWSAQRLYRPYVKWSLVVALTLGFTTGAGMLLMRALEVSVGMSWVTYTQAHGVAQLFGWAGMFLMGMAFHIVPRFRNSSIKFPWPQRAVLVLLLLGILLRFIGQTVPSLAISDLLLFTSWVSLALGIGVFVAVIGQALRGGTTPQGLPEAWLWMSLLWSVVAAGLHLVTVAQMASAHLLVAPVLTNSAFTHAALVGFIGNFILGISIRSVPASLALPPLRLKLGRLGLLAINIGVALTISAVSWVPYPGRWSAAQCLSYWGL